MATSSSTKKPDIRAVKKKICIKKADIGQCRLCMRVVPRSEVRQTRGDNSVDLSRKIETAVSVRIMKTDKLTTICVNCLRLVDITYNFRMACMKTNIIFSGKLVMLDEGNWLSEEKVETLNDCQELVRRHRLEMDKLFACTGLEAGSLEHAISVKEEPILQVKEDSVEPPKPDEIEDSDPEGSEDFAKKMENLPVKNEKRKIDNGSVPIHRFVCEICGETVDRYNEEHHRNKHLDVTPYQCTLCPMAFRSKVAIDRHKVAQHEGGAAARECQICHKMIRGKGQYKLHVARHKDPTMYTVPCPICGKRYRKNYIEDHMNTHTGNMKHECEICGKQFCAKTNYITHMKRFHTKAEKNEPAEQGYGPGDLNWK